MKLVLSESLKTELINSVVQEKERLYKKDVDFRIRYTTYCMDEVLDGAEQLELESIITFAQISCTETYVTLRKDLGLSLLEAASKISNYAKYQLSILHSFFGNQKAGRELVLDLIEDNYIPAYARLANFYLRGEGFPRSYDKYIEYLTISSRKGNIRSKLKLAQNRLRKGSIVNKFLGLITYPYIYAIYFVVLLKNDRDERLL